VSSLQRYLDNVVAEDSWGHPNWNEWAATLFDELVSCVESLEERVESLEERVESLTEAHDAAQPEPAQTYGDKRGTYAEQPAPDGWLAECAENWWVHQRGSTDTNRSRWALQYADRLIAAAKRTQCVERALPANAQAEKDLRKAEDILANVVDCIRGRITHRDPRDKREQLLWFASELKRAAEEIGALLEERW